MSGWKCPDARIIEILDGHIVPTKDHIPLIEKIVKNEIEHYNEDEAEQIRNILNKLMGL